MPELPPDISRTIRSIIAASRDLPSDQITSETSLLRDLDFEEVGWIGLLKQIDRQLDVASAAYHLQVDANIKRATSETVEQHTLEYLQTEFPSLDLQSDRFEEIYTVGFIEALVANAMYPCDGLPYRAIDAPTGIKWGDELSEELGERRFRLFLAGIARHLRRKAPLAEWPKKVIEDIETFADNPDLDFLKAAFESAQHEHEASLGGRFIIRPNELSLVFSLHPETPGMALAQVVNFIKQRDTPFVGFGEFQVTTQIDAIRTLMTLKSDLLPPTNALHTMSTHNVSPDAVALADQMYESRDFSSMNRLADCLVQDGIDHDDIHAHCRDDAVYHMRGCWVIDALRTPATG